MQNLEDYFINEEKDLIMINQITEALENNTYQLYSQSDLMFICDSFLRYAKSETFIIALIKCITAYIKKGIRLAYDMINKGVHKRIISLINPSQNNPKVSVEIAIEARHCLMQLFQYDEIIFDHKVDFNYSFFIDNFYKFPLAEQKILMEYTKNLSARITTDDCANAFVQASMILTHFDIQIATDAACIIFNSFSKGTLRQLKIIDPIITKYLSISLEVITDIQLISTILHILYRSCQISYEYAENLVNLPIDFGLIIHNMDADPPSDLTDIILKIIHQIFSFSTLRKGNDRNSKISKFAFYVQPVIIQLIKQNIGDINLALECLSDTLDVYIPITEINNILDAITHIVSSGNNKLDIKSFYDKLTENKKIKEAINQYEKLKIPTPTAITTITDFKSFIDASNLHSSSFALSESLQNSILKILKSIKSPKLMEMNLSTKNYHLIQQSFAKIVSICQKMIIYNTSKPASQSEQSIFKKLGPSEVKVTIFDQSGEYLYLNVSNAMSLSICEAFFNFMKPNAPQTRYTQLPLVSYQYTSMPVNINNFADLISSKSINNDAKAALFCHLLCYQSNKQLSSPVALGHYNFYYIKSQGKIYSIYDNINHAANQSNQFEMIEIQKTEQNPTEEDFINRSDIIHKNKSEENKECIINFSAFHKSFDLAYPTLNLQKRAFDYYNKVTLPVIETSLQIIKEIHRLFSNLQPERVPTTNNDNDNNISTFFKNIFENKIFGWRLIESLDLKSLFSSRNVTTSTFINFPFLFPLEQRLIFLKITSLSHLQSYFTLVDEVFIKPEKKIATYQRMNLLIDKTRLFDEGLTVFNVLSPGSIYYDVKFKDENGLGIGPTQEFFRLFSLEMQHNSLDIWLSDDYNEKNSLYATRKEEKGLFPSPLSVRRPDLFFTLGSLCAKSIEMGIVLPLHFSPAFFKLIRGQRIELDEVSSTYSKSLQNKEGLFGLTFTMPGRNDVELRNGGKVLLTDEGNVDLYVELLRRILTFDVFCDEECFEEEEEIEKNERDKKTKRLISGNSIDLNPKLAPASSNGWKNLQKTSSNNNPSLARKASHSSLQPSDSLSLSSSSSSSIHLKKAVSANIRSSSRTINQSSSSLTFLELIKNDNENDNDDDSISDVVTVTDDDDIDVEIPGEIAGYIQRYSFEICASMFKEGFGRIIPWSAMDLFTPEEICLLIEGEDDFSLDSLKENIIIGAGYESNSPQIVWLFEILNEDLSKLEKKLFTRFLTGCDSFGVFGLKSLEPKLSISMSEKGDDSLPSTSTCSNSLKLPKYSSKEILKKKLLYAIYECNETFYLS